ncbi:MAG: hypothetical protein OXC72_03670 [Roseovarius sp.]|nr:hypothetical protein [Roseovarius sp.]
MNKVALLALLVLAPAAWSQEDEITDHDRFALWDRFELWDNCRPMNLLVEGLSSDAAKINLTKQDIEIAVRSRLRAARLYDGETTNALYVQVTVAKSAFFISTQYIKRVEDTYNGLVGFSPTWRAGTIGTHRQDSSYILSTISPMVDRFIDEYLRVNESGCSK